MKLIFLILFFTSLTFGQSDLLLLFDDADSVDSPTSILAVGNVAKITLSWTNAATYDSVKIYRGTSTNPTALVYTLAGNLVSKVDTPLTKGTLYYYRVKGKIGGNLSSYSSNASDTAVFSAEAQQYFDRLPTAIAIDTLTFIAAFVDSMQSRGYWGRVDEMWLLANKTQADALIGLKGFVNATIGGTVTFTAYRGIASNGTTGYVGTGYNPSTDGIQFTLNDCGFGFYSRTNGQSEGHDFGGRDAINFTRIKSRSTGDVIDTWVNQAVTNTSRANTSSNGFIYANRTSSTVYGSYRNGVVIVSANTAVSTGLLNVDMSLGGQNNQGVVANFTTREYSFAIVGDAFTAAEQVLIYGFLETLLDHLGAGVM